MKALETYILPSLTIEALSRCVHGPWRHRALVPGTETGKRSLTLSQSVFVNY